MAQTNNISYDFGYRDAYRAAIKGDSETLLQFCSQHPMVRINASGDTIFHILALNCHAKVISELLLKLPLDGLMTMRNGVGDSPLHKAARVGCVKIADLMLQKEASLITACNLLGETPIYGAAACGQVKMLRFFFRKPDCENGLRRKDGSTILHAALMGEFYGLALVIMEAYPDLALAHNDKGITPLHLLAQSPLSFRSGTIYSRVNLGSSSFIPLAILAIIIYSCVPMNVYSVPMKENPWDSSIGIHQLGRMKQLLFKPLRCLPWLKQVIDVKQKHNDALEVVKQLVEIESKHSRQNYYINHGEDPDHNLDLGLQWNKYEVLSGKNSNRDPLLQATKCGIIEIVQMILKEFPDAIEVLDQTGKNILHLVAEHRQDKIFEFLNSEKVPITQMLLEVDKEGNTPLHLAAKYGFYQQRHVLSVLHQMPWEIFWFKHVRHFSPLETHHLQNVEGQTPKELFEKTHKGILQQSEKWLKDYTGAAMVTSVLVASFWFTAAITVPGGFDQNSGLPVLLHHKYLNSYFDLVSLCLLSSWSTLAGALYAHSSRFQQEDFYIILPLIFLLNSSFLFFNLIFTGLAYVETRRLESWTHVQNIYGHTEDILAFFIGVLMYIDKTLPVYGYLIQVLFPSIPY